jgi:hypothetical protein
MTKKNHTAYLFNLPTKLYDKLRKQAFDDHGYMCNIIIAALEAHLKKEK